MKIETLPLPNAGAESTSIETAIEAVADFMGVRKFGQEKWRLISEGENISSPEDSEWHGEYWLFVSEVVQPLAIALGAIAGNCAIRLTDDDGSICEIDGRLFARREFAGVVQCWNAPPDLSYLPNEGAGAADKFQRLVIGVSETCLRGFLKKG